MSFPNKSKLFKAMVNELKTMSQALGYGGLTVTQKGNLCYGFNQINPKDVDELAVVIALGVQQAPSHELIDKYLALRDPGAKHCSPFDKIDGICDALEKTHGLLIFYEDVESLLTELTGKHRTLPCSVLIDKDSLYQSLKEEYKRRLTKEDLWELNEALNTYIRIGMIRYSWCQDLAERIVDAG